MAKNNSWLSPYKATNHMDWLLAYASGQSTYPVHVEIHPTTRCNQRCKRCAAVIPKIEGKKRIPLAYQRDVDVPLERFLQLIDEFAELGVKAITLSGGGEPLVYEGLVPLLSRIHERGLRLGLLTNLNVPIDGELLDLLRRAEFVRVSLDAGDAETYQRLHRPADGGNFARVLDNIAAIRNECADLGVNYLVQVENYTGIERAAALARELGVTYIRFTPAHTVNEGREYLPIWDQIAAQLDAAKKYETETFTVIGAVHRFRNMVENKKDYPKCVYHEMHPIIGSDLTVYPCCILDYFEGNAMINVANCSFKEAWDSAARRKFSEKLDPRGCPPCWFDEQNRLMNYITLKEKRHAYFV